MKLAYFALSAALLLAGCNQTPPATSKPTVDVPAAAVTPAATPAAYSQLVQALLVRPSSP